MTTIWVLLAVAAVIAEMMTGTLYLLVVGAAAGLAALASSLDLSLVIQSLLAAVVAVAGSVLVSRFRKPQAGDMAPDLQGGAEVVALGEAGRLRVRWRGTEWDARADEVLMIGDAVAIVQQQGNVVQVRKLA